MTLGNTGYLPRESESLVGIFGREEAKYVLLYSPLEVVFEDYIIPTGLLNLLPKASILHPALIVDPYLLMELVSPKAGSQEELFRDRFRAVMENKMFRCYTVAEWPLPRVRLH
jgi:hypothetical protein